jgi:hypothetical protein
VICEYTSVIGQSSQKIENLLRIKMRKRKRIYFFDKIQIQ